MLKKTVKKNSCKFLIFEVILWDNIKAMYFIPYFNDINYVINPILKNLFLNAITLKVIKNFLKNVQGMPHILEISTGVYGSDQIWAWEFLGVCQKCIGSNHNCLINDLKC